MMNLNIFVLLMVVFASNQYNEDTERNGECKSATDKIEDEEFVKKQWSSQFIGVNWYKKNSKWRVSRWSKTAGKMIFNGLFNADDEIKAAYASDTLARMLMKNGEKGHKLNFSEDDTEVWPEKTSQYFGVHWFKVLWFKGNSKWRVSRWSKTAGKIVSNGYFNVDNGIKAAHASDTLARKLMKNGEKGHKLNFPEDETEVWQEKETSSEYFGVSWHKSKSKWQVRRRSKIDGKIVYNGYFKLDEEMKAGQASDALAKNLMKNGEKGHKLNFPENPTGAQQEKQNKKRKRVHDLNN